MDGAYRCSCWCVSCVPSESHQVGRFEMTQQTEAARRRSRCVWWLCGQCTGGKNCRCIPAAATIGPPPMSPKNGNNSREYSIGAAEVSSVAVDTGER